MRFCIFLPVCTKGQLSACALCPICLSIVVAKKQMPRIAARYRASLVGVDVFKHRKAVPESLSLRLALFPNRNSRDVEGAVPYDLHRFSIVIRGTSWYRTPLGVSATIGSTPQSGAGTPSPTVCRDFCKTERESRLLDSLFLCLSAVWFTLQLRAYMSRN